MKKETLGAIAAGALFGLFLLIWFLDLAGGM